MHHFDWLFSNSILSNIFDTGTSKFERYYSEGEDTRQCRAVR